MADPISEITKVWQTAVDPDNPSVNEYISAVDLNSILVYTINLLVSGSNDEASFKILVDTDPSGAGSPAAGTVYVGTYNGKIWSKDQADTIEYLATETGLGTKEASLGNPTVSGYLLASTDAGTRSWVAPYSASVERVDFVAQVGNDGQNFTISSNLAATDLVYVNGALFYDYSGIGTTTLTTDYILMQGSKLTWRK